MSSSPSTSGELMSPRVNIRESAEERFTLQRSESHLAVKKHNGGRNIIQRIGDAIKGKFGRKVQFVQQLLDVEIKRIVRKLKGLATKRLTEKYGDKLGGLAAAVLEEALDFIIPSAIEGLTEGIQVGINAIL